MAAAYGFCPIALDYAGFVGLWLQLDRVRLQRAADVLLALEAHRSGGWGGRWFEALAILEGQAEELAFRVEWARDQARAKAAVRDGRLG